MCFIISNDVWSASLFVERRDASGVIQVMMNLGTDHPDFTYANDRRQAKLALVLTIIAAVACVLLIVAVVG